MPLVETLSATRARRAASSAARAASRSARAASRATRASARCFSFASSCTFRRSAEKKPRRKKNKALPAEAVQIVELPNGANVAPAANMFRRAALSGRRSESIDPSMWALLNRLATLALAAACKPPQGQSFSRAFSMDLRGYSYYAVFEEQRNMGLGLLRVALDKIQSDIYEEQHWAIKVFWQLLRLLNNLKHLSDTTATSSSGWFCNHVGAAVVRRRKFVPRAYDALLELLLGRQVVRE